MGKGIDRESKQFGDHRGGDKPPTSIEAKGAEGGRGGGTGRSQGKDPPDECLGGAGQGVRCPPMGNDLATFSVFLQVKGQAAVRYALEVGRGVVQEVEVAGTDNKLDMPQEEGRVVGGLAVLPWAEEEKETEPPGIGNHESI